MNKSAFIVTSSMSYFLGLNSILNAFDYYEHKGIDVIMMSPYSLDDYYEYAKDKFSFTLKREKVEEWGDPTIVAEADDTHKGIFAENENCIWAKYNYMLSIKDEYDAICWMDADMLLLSNLEHYFKIAAQTDLIMCPQFVRGGHWIEDYHYPPFKDAPDDLARGMPVMPFITFFNPKYNIDIVQYVWDNRCKTNPSEEMYLFNKALYKLNKIDQVLELPGGIWLASEYFWYASTLLKGGGKLSILTPAPNADKIMTMHSRYWNKTLTKVELERHKDYPEIKKHIYENARLAEYAINLFNYQGKVTFNELRKLNPYYEQKIVEYEGVTY